MYKFPTIHTPTEDSVFPHANSLPHVINTMVRIVRLIESKITRMIKKCFKTRKASEAVNLRTMECLHVSFIVAIWTPNKIALCDYKHSKGTLHHISTPDEAHKKIPRLC